MNIAPYRLVLRQPGLKLLMLIGFLARIPATAAGMVTTLHVITALHLDYAAAGVAGALGMAGVGIGSPLFGRLVDRIGARPVMIVTSAAQGVYWLVAPELSYPLLVACAFVSGLLSIPIFSTMRQFVAALTPVDQRRTAFALDSMAVELAYMLGPALAVAAVTSINSRIAMYFVGAGLVAAGFGLVLLNPPIRSEAEAAEDTGAPVLRRQWITPGMVALLGVTAATTFILSATELSVVAVLNNGGVTRFTGLVIGLWCVYSLVGGFVYGALHRTVSSLTLISGLGLLTVPIGLLAGAPWWWLLFALIPTGLLCAPSLASTVDTVSKWVPAAARGEAMGLHGAALTIGIAAGAPVAGAVIDAFGPGWGFATAGACGALLVALAVPFWPRSTAPAEEISAQELPVPVSASR
ncbi:MAG TPA: MFS transporter [Candidatus Limnocylindrales bacterium]|nr:MFS transporter [Candidatus Limnocylindrales bacterium]